MGAYILRRLLHGIVVVLGVTVIVFTVTRLVGDPVRVMLPIDASEEQRDTLRHQLGLDKPIPLQFVEFIGNAAKGDFGESLWQRRPASEIVLERMPKTLELVFLAMAFSMLISVPLGILAALRPGHFSDNLTVFISLIGLSVPQFWLGLILMVVFSVGLAWLPTSGTGTPLHFVLPMLTMALPAIGRLAMIVRSSMIDELNQAYVKTAIAKGMPAWRVVCVHALRNAAIPITTMSAWELIRALAGYSVVVEVVFAWPGLGQLAMQAIQRQDVVLLQTVVFAIAIMVVLINITMDVVYNLIDPRVKYA